MHEQLTLLAGVWIEIRYQKDGRQESAYVMTDSQGRFLWQPPVGTTGAYFRATEGTTTGFLIITGAEGLIPLWTPTDFPKIEPVPTVDCVVKGRVLCSTVIRQLTVAFKYEMLPPDEHYFQMMDEAEVKPDFSKLRAQVTKMQTPHKANRRHGALWKIFHHSSSPIVVPRAFIR